MRSKPPRIPFLTLEITALLLLLFVTPVMLRAGGPAQASEAAEFQGIWRQAEAARDTGDAERALGLVEAALAALPDALRLQRWEIDFGETTIERVLIGRSSVYLVTGSSVAPRHLFGDDAQPLISDDTHRYDFEMKIRRFDVASGAWLWTRRTAGRFETVLDPATDDLYLYRRTLRPGRRFIHLDAKSGEARETAAADPAPTPPDGLRLSGRLVIPRPYEQLEAGRGAAATIFDPVTGERSTRLAEGLGLRAPGGHHRLKIAADRDHAGRAAVQFSLWSTSSPSSRLWSRTIPGRGLHPPVWLEDGLVVATGFENNQARVALLNLETGEAQWEVVLPRGIYVPGRDQLGNGSYAPASWIPVQRSGGRLLVVSGDGTLSFLSPADGAVLSRLSPFDNYLTAPTVVKDLLVVGSLGVVRAIPLHRIRGVAEVDEARLLLFRARLLKELGRGEEALDSVRDLSERIPLDAEVWRFRGELARQAGHELEETAAESRYLALTGTTTSRELRRRHGLERRIATGSDLLAEPTLGGEALFVATTGGGSLRLDTHTLEITGRRQHSVGLHRLEVEVEGGGYDLARPLTVERVWGPPPLPDAPPEFLQHSGYDGPLVEYRGRHFRPTRGGVIRILDQGVMRTLSSGVEGMDRWAIHIGPAGPLGYGTGGVFRLDEDLRPVERLVAVGREPRQERDREVLLFSADETAFALIFRQGKRHRLQIWSLDGRRLLRDEEIAPIGYVRGRPQRLRPLAGGFLLAAEEILWIHRDPQRPTWRFAFPDPPGRAQPRQRFAHTTRFSPPVLSNGRLFVGCRDGGVYVFRVAEIVGEGGDGALF